MESPAVSPLPGPGHNRRERLRGHSTPPQPNLFFSSEPGGGGEESSAFEEFDVEEQLWGQPASSRTGFSSSQARGGVFGRPMSMWMMLVTSTAMVLAGLAALVTICFSSYRAWLPSEALLEESTNATHSALTPKLLETVETSLWWVVIVGTAVGNSGILLFQFRTPRLVFAFAVITSLVALVQLITTLVMLRRSVSFFRNTNAPGSLPHLRESLGTMWSALSQSTSGSVALCAIQQQLQCSGITTCCITNSSPVEVTMPKASEALCFISYNNGSMVDKTGVDIQSVVAMECGYLALDTSCAAPVSLATCADQMEGALVAPYAFAFVAQCTLTALLVTVTYFTWSQLQGRTHTSQTSTHVVAMTDTFGANTALDDEEYDPYAY